MSTERQNQQDQKVKLVEKTLNLLQKEDNGENLSDFTRVLYRLAASEDLILYSEKELAKGAKEAFKQVHQRQFGKASIRVENPAIKDAAGQTNTITIIEIINDDMPFLVDSVMGELQERHCDLKLVLHPIIWVERNNEGDIEHYYGAQKPEHTSNAKAESVILIHVERIESFTQREALKESLEIVMRDVRMAVQDWHPMRQRLEKTLNAYKKTPPPISTEEINEAIAFIEWMLDDNFTFLGMREYDFIDDQEGGELRRTQNPGLGILGNKGVRILRRGSEYVVFTPELLEFLKKPEPLIVTKANVKSNVHRHIHMDYIGVKLFDEKGGLTGELRVVGLFSATAYNRSTRRIPYLRRKIDHVLKLSGFDPNSHSGKSLLNVLDTYPRDELFQLDVETLFDFSMIVLQLLERPRIRVLPRIDKFDRFVSILTYIPRERYSTDVRIKIGTYLSTIFKGRLSAWYVSYPDGPLARVHFIIGRVDGKTPQIERSTLEHDISDIVRTWADHFHDVLSQRFEPARAYFMFDRYANAFTNAYREFFSADTAVEDMALIERLSEHEPISIAMRKRDGLENRCDLKLYHYGSPIPLTDRLPIIENMGFNAINERTYRVERNNATPIWIHDILLEREDNKEIDLETLGQKLEACFMAVWRGDCDNDGFNALVLRAGIPWRDGVMLRALAHYLKQAGIKFSRDYLWSTLNKHKHITLNLVELFHAKMDPSKNEDEREIIYNKINAALQMDLEDVASLDEDKILRSMINLIEAMLRTNFFQLNQKGLPHKTLAFKFNSKEIKDLPEPKPLREIFVFSTQFEGVHLRGGMIARGGLRWSDREQDFRTEILGLAKAQQTKNAVIVPFGAKGGFVPKNLPDRSNRDAWLTEGINCYKNFINSLLSVTDNLDQEEIIHPPQVVRHDGDDPYLVVAADKGTATFSDIANSISEEHNFWLDDAFASGGSVGYDHKKMGITARGGWEAVKRHFREINHDIQNKPFTVVGVGDMSGDVFGNGMLLSEQTKLIAAFDHRDIFIDPDPDPLTSFAERKRLFELGRSSWKDYNEELISKGGGIFPRSSKSIHLSKEAQSVLNVDKETLTPNEIMTAILKSHHDLLWFGGIGTYIRESGETDSDAGDKANDAIRITAKELNVKVVGEGANLGMTQRARIEFAQKGGRINTDAIDNSAGVNSSDMEVNIKITFGAAERAEKINRQERNVILEHMTDEVADLVLRNNYLQTLAISLTEKLKREDLPFQTRLMRRLEDEGLLNRAVEFLPDDLELIERDKANEGLTRPEIAVLMAYAKIILFDKLLASNVPDDDYLGKELFRYFPTPMHEKFKDEIIHHRLRREIIATMLSNSMINRGGSTLIQRVMDTTGANVTEIAFAFATVRDSYELTELNNQIDNLDNQIDGEIQLELYAAVQSLMLGRINWFLKNAPSTNGLSKVIDHYKKGLHDFEPTLEKNLSKAMQKLVNQSEKRYLEAKVPGDLSKHIAMIPVLQLLPDMILVKDQTSETAEKIAHIYFKIGALFSLSSIDRHAGQLATEDYYDRLALERAREIISTAWRIMVIQALQTKGGFKAWHSKNSDRIERTVQTVNDIVNDERLTVSRLAVAAGLLNDLTNI